MTSRQAYQRYRQQSGPRYSMEEQRRLERQEEGRVREEKDAERSRLRYKTARDRKKAKEERERLERRKSGLPSADCRPSQGLISGFARGNEKGGKRKLDQDDSTEELGGGRSIVEAVPASQAGFRGAAEHRPSISRLTTMNRTRGQETQGRPQLPATEFSDQESKSPETGNLAGWA